MVRLRVLDRIEERKSRHLRQDRGEVVEPKGLRGDSFWFRGNRSKGVISKVDMIDAGQESGGSQGYGRDSGKGWAASGSM